MELSKNARFIINKKLLRLNRKGQVIERPEVMFWRVAKNIASADEIYDKKADLKKIATEFFLAMTNLEFLPNFPTLRNAGRELQQLSACYVLPVGDSIEEIFEAVKNLALIQRSGGGTGFSFSRLRPEGSRIRVTGGVSSGPVSFMKVFDTATGVILEGGTRRGANLGCLRVDHPDILKFINCKKQPGQFTNFNISVAVTKKFMEAIKTGKNYELIDPSTKEISQKISARKVLGLMAQMAWLNGEPGVIFIDRINKFNPTPALGEIETTNVCGEVDLLPFESCNLGSINLSKVVKKREVDWERLKELVDIGIHFLDNVIDKTAFPLSQIEEITKGNRKLGLGVMGFADMLIKLKIPYNSDQALKLTEKLMKFIDKESKKASQNLAKKRGTFPNFKKSIYSKKNLKLRNATTTAIAPTGTLSLLSNTSPGIEPNYSPAYLEDTTFRKKPLLIINSLFEKIAREKGFYSKKLIQKILAKGTCQGIEEVPKDIQKIFVSAHDILPDWHLKIQAAFQKYTDNSISKTINLPQKAKKEDVKKIFILADNLGLKGLTVYRERSRGKQILSTCPSCKL